MLIRFATLLVMLSGFMVAGCNTMEGAGKDIERGGEKLQDAASKKKTSSTDSTTPSSDTAKSSN